MDTNQFEQKPYIELVEKKPYMNTSGEPEARDMIEMMAYRDRRFSTGLVLGTIIGTAMVWYAVSLLKKTAAAKKQLPSK